MTVNLDWKVPDFRHIGFNSPITEVAVFLVAQKDREYSSLGSGIIIGPTITMTARHVVDELFADIYEGAPLENLSGVGTFSLQAFQFLENGTKFRVWDVRQIYATDPALTDIVFLRLQPTSQDHLQYDWKKVRMQLRPPEVGSKVAAFGYHSTSIEMIGDEVKITTNPYTATGIVEEIHEQRRDFRLPFPCFRTNARFDPAMSGGPVFTEQGYLCGIICSNLPCPDGSHVSYVASLWPSMGILVSYNRDGYPHDKSYPAIELASGGFLTAVDLDKVAVLHDPITNNRTVRVIRENPADF